VNGHNITQLGISSKKRPALDVPPRWNSTYLMLLSAVEYRIAFEALDSQDLSYMDLPSPDEWKWQIFFAKYSSLSMMPQMWF
jgi:hypothetical protein